MKLVFATSNRGKLREAADILGEAYELVTPADLRIFEDIPETGDTIMDNSLQKALYLYDKTGLDCFADDTGLEVDALGGAPGVHTARYAGKNHDFQANIDKLLSELEGLAPEARTARFHSVVTLMIDGEPHYFEGIMEGRIADKRYGAQGFGYDPVFISNVRPDKTLAEMGEAFKNEISHRGQSLRAMAEWLKQNSF